MPSDLPHIMTFPLGPECAPLSFEGIIFFCFRNIKDSTRKKKYILIAIDVGDCIIIVNDAFLIYSFNAVNSHCFFESGDYRHKKFFYKT